MKKNILFGALVMILVLALVVGCNSTQPTAANNSAPDYPTKAITVYVAYTAGGGMDTGIRTLAPFLEEKLGQSVVVENRPGASGVTGFTTMAKAAADGYEAGITNLPALTANYVFGFLSVDPQTAYEYVGAYDQPNSVIVVSKDSKYKTLEDLSNYLKENPQGATIAVSGKISSDALTALSYETAAGVKIKMVSFEGGKECITAVMGGHIDATVLSQNEFAPYYESGDLVALGIGGDERLKALPDVPTFKEQGLDMPLKGELHVLAVPAGTDAKIVEKLREALKETVANPEFLSAANKVGMLEPVYIDADQVKKEVKEQTEWLKTLPPIK